MELTADALAGMSRQADGEHQLAIRAALGNSKIGLLPDTPFNNKGVFVRNTFEIEHFRCTALLASGKIIDANEPVVVTIPMLFGEAYYLTVGFSKEEKEFEKDGIPYRRPQYEYHISTLEEIEAGDLMPVVRFRSKEGVFSIDPDFIPPTLQLVCDNRFKSYINSYVEHLEAITSHEHLTDEFGKRAMLHYFFLLKSYSQKTLTSEFMQLTQELAQAIGYYIMSLIPGKETVTAIPECNRYDIEMWLRWLDDYLKSARSLLDQVVVEDRRVDFDELKAQIKAELYEQMTPELQQKLKAEIRDELRPEMERQLEGTLTSYMEQTLGPTLREHLGKELAETLHGRLYNSLYDALYNALFVPAEEDEAYVPMI